jgi:branched-chain amino acid transport system ATP-binding protein
MMLDIKDLSVSYGMHRALENVSVSVKPGEIVVILGANGAGKSTLLKAVAGMCEGTASGRISLDGEDLGRLEAHDIVERGIAFVPEGRGIFGDLTVAENLLLGAYSVRARARQEQNLQWIYSLFPKLTERKNQIARTMSGGEQQMVAIGRAIMADPKFLMLDEPSLGLSPLLCKELFQSLSHISETGMGVLLVEQNAKQSLAIADRGYLIENGAITGSDEAKALLNDPAVQAAYLGAGGKTQPVRPRGPGGAGPSKTPASDKHFIRPGTIARTGATTDTMAGESITAMVARAAGRAQTPKPAVPKAPVTRPVAPARPSGTARPAAPARPPVAMTATPTVRDPEIARILADIEQAAKEARTQGTSYAPPPEARERDETPEDLPTIPVYRKSQIQIYKRGPDGILRRTKEK